MTRLVCRKNHAGFTLIELMVALTIYSIIAVCIYYNLHGGIRMWSRENEIIAQNQRLRVFSDMISRDMRNAIALSLSAPRWTEDSASFFTIADVSAEEKTYKRPMKKIYYFDDEKGELKTAAVMEREGFEPKLVDEKILLEGLDSVSLEYAYEAEEGYEWKAKWETDDAAPPRGVRIRLKFKGKDGRDSGIFENIVFIPTGKLGQKKEK